jgi:hypothetical protein
MDEHDAESLTLSDLKGLVKLVAGMVAIGMLGISLLLLGAGWVLTTMSGNYHDSAAVCISFGAASMVGAVVAAITRDDPRLQTYRQKAKSPE